MSERRNRGRGGRSKSIHTENVQEKYEGSNGYVNIHMSKSQNKLIEKINSNTIVFVEGPAGTGKSTAILYAYVREYLKDKTKKIVVIKTPVEAGTDKIGFLPDDYKAKIAPHFAPIKKILEGLLTKAKVEIDTDNRIFFNIPNYILGDTLDNALIFIDEAQQLQPKILKLLLERIGKNSICVVAGDRTQLYVNDKSRNALSDGIERFFHKDLNGDLRPNYNNIAHHAFNIDDVMRSDIVKSVITAYSDLN